MKIRIITIDLSFLGGIFKNCRAELTFTPLLTVAGFFSRLLIVPCKFLLLLFIYFALQVLLLLFIVTSNIIVIVIICCGPDIMDCALESVIALFCCSMGPENFSNQFPLSPGQHCRLNICSYFDKN